MNARFTIVALACLLIAQSARAAEAYAPSVKARPILKTETDAAGHVIKYPGKGTPELSGYLVEIPPGGQTGWHMHPYPCMAYVLEGTIAVEQGGGPVRTYKKGDSFAELVKTRHNGRNLGDKPVKILLFVVGVRGAGPSVKD